MPKLLFYIIDLATFISFCFIFVVLRINSRVLCTLSRYPTPGPHLSLLTVLKNAASIVVMESMTKKLTKTLPSARAHSSDEDGGLLS